MVRVNWTKLAVNDLKNVYEYISKDSKRYAKMQVVQIKSSAKILAQFPSAGKIITEIKKEELRKKVEGNYRIIYKIISSERIDIITVHHAARDLTKRKIK